MVFKNSFSLFIAVFLVFSTFKRSILRFALLFVLITSGLSLLSCSEDDNSAKISGFVLSGNQPIELSTVTLYSTGTERGIEILGSAQSDSSGFFSISYKSPSDPDAVLYLTADSNLISLSQRIDLSNLNPIRLATVLGQRRVPSEVVINERTTVATAYTMAQFFTPSGIDGTYPGLQNAAAIAQNLVELSSGGIGHMLDTFPNGGSTSTRATLNALANMLVSCVRSEADCDSLFTLATPPGAFTPVNTLRAALTPTSPGRM